MKKFSYPILPLMTLATLLGACSGSIFSDKKESGNPAPTNPTTIEFIPPDHIPPNGGNPSQRGALATPPKELPTDKGGAPGSSRNIIVVDYLDLYRILFPQQLKASTDDELSKLALLFNVLAPRKEQIKITRDLRSVKRTVEVRALDISMQDEKVMGAFQLEITEPSRDVNAKLDTTKFIASGTLGTEKNIKFDIKVTNSNYELNGQTKEVLVNTSGKITIEESGKVTHTYDLKAMKSFKVVIE